MNPQPAASTKRKDAPTYPVSAEAALASTSLVAAITVLLSMHLGHVCMPGAAGIARRGVRETRSAKARFSDFPHLRSGHVVICNSSKLELERSFGLRVVGTIRSVYTKFQLGRRSGRSDYTLEARAGRRQPEPSPSDIPARAGTPAFPAYITGNADGRGKREEERARLENALIVGKPPVNPPASASVISPPLDLALVSLKKFVTPFSFYSLVRVAAAAKYVG